MNQEYGLKDSADTVASAGFSCTEAYWNLNPAELASQALLNQEGYVVDSGALAVDTGKFTGRSPKDRFIVCDQTTEKTIWWGEINIRFSAEKYAAIRSRMLAYFQHKKVYVRDAYACADPKFRLNLRVFTEKAYANLFAYNLFLRPSEAELQNPIAGWRIISAAGFLADPEKDGTRQGNFSIINFTAKEILIGGTGYTGEMKKGIFSVLNYLLPQEQNVLSMHCSANTGKDDATAIFFGLSGTGKTTLSADPARNLIGDDEHGWDQDTVFNFEGGCYAKCVDLSPEKEPQIWQAVRAGALLENIRCYENTKKVNFADISITENTRVSYPIDYIAGAVKPSVGQNPKNIFFLTADAFGVLPPIAKLSRQQAMFYFILGYTAKVAGTEAGINEPQATFSACFGKVFLPLHPAKYAQLLGNKLENAAINVWLVNTGWTGGAYGVGKRMELTHTRSLISAALNGALNKSVFTSDPIFGLAFPENCPNVPHNLLNPRLAWKSGAAYDAQAINLAKQFKLNFEPYAAGCSAEICAAAPKIK